MPSHFAVKRFDRVTPDAGRSVDGLPIPYRLHQEDVFQAKGISRELKYEPTGVNYLGLIVDAVRRASTNQMEDRFLVGYNQLFDYAVGNCDNHLKKLVARMGRKLEAGEVGAAL